MVPYSSKKCLPFMWHYFITSPSQKCNSQKNYDPKSCNNRTTLHLQTTLSQERFKKMWISISLGMWSNKKHTSVVTISLWSFQMMLDLWIFLEAWVIFSHYIWCEYLRVKHTFLHFYKFSKFSFIVVTWNALSCLNSHLKANNA